MVDPCVSLQGVGKRFHAQWVLRDLSFNCPAGQTTAIVGESGSGKSTLLQLINAVYLPDAGSIEVFGQTPPTIDTPHYRRGIGYGVQGAGLFPHMTVRRNVTLLAKLEGWSERDIAVRFAELLGLTGLDESLAGRYPNQLSGGQQQRVGLCRALMLKPRMLLLDEPFSAVDPITRLGLHEQFLNIRRVETVSTLLVTHDMREARKLAVHLVILKEGRVIQEGPTREVIEAPIDDYVKGLLESLE
jgi:osmoprotectant transport system ATP-binding protein